MLQVDLSSLSGPELRSLLDTTRARGQADLSYRILQEMEARRAREPGPRGLLKRRRRGPKVIELNLGDPLEPEPDPDDDTPPFSVVREPPLEIARPSDAIDNGPPPERQRKIGFRTGIAVGVVGGLALGLGVAEITFQPNAPAATPPIATLLAPQPAVVTAPAPPAQLQVVADTAPAPPAAAEAAPEAPPTEVAENAAPPTDAVATAKEILAPPAEEEKAPVEPPVKTLAVSKACAGQPTPADRIICDDPDLQKLQRELRQAYARALDAHEDRALLREHQLAWADARDSVTDPVKLARLYEQRIRKLDAATADAERQR
jgi:uncharacterized protein YecT (DUF1311 family)